MVVQEMSPDVAETPLRRRLPWLIVVSVLVFAALFLRLWQLQIIRGEDYYTAALKNFVRQSRISAMRGRILDSEQIVLAENRPTFRIKLMPKRLTDASLARLATLLAWDAQTLLAVRQRVRTSNSEWTVDETISLEQVTRVRAEEERLPGVAIIDQFVRDYPFHEWGSHALGYLTLPMEQELAALDNEGWLGDQMIGRLGIEKMSQPYLQGKLGLLSYIVNAHEVPQREVPVNAFIDGPAEIPPIPGHDIVLTIDWRLQTVAEKAAAKYPSVAVVALDVNTGAILAMVSTPSFDPNSMTGRAGKEQAGRLKADPRKPYLDKTIGQLYPPGSLFKVVTALAALQDGIVVPSDRNVCPGYYQKGKSRFRCMKTHGSVDLPTALQMSCNTYFWRLADKMGIDRIAEVAKEFGFGQTTSLGLVGEAAGTIPNRAWYAMKKLPYYPGLGLNAATGQGDDTVTVLQMALAYAALANGGNLWLPRIVKRIQDSQGRVIFENEPVLRHKVAVDPKLFAPIRDGLWRVVNQAGGTGHSQMSQVVEFAGKTGTAQVGKGIIKAHDDTSLWDESADHAWFAGYAPAAHPEIVVAVLIEHGGAGGKMAAPVAKEIFEAYAGLKKAAP